MKTMKDPDDGGLLFCFSKRHTAGNAFGRQPNAVMDKQSNAEEKERVKRKTNGEGQRGGFDDPRARNCPLDLAKK